MSTFDNPRKSLTAKSKFFDSSTIRSKVKDFINRKEETGEFIGLSYIKRKPNKPRRIITGDEWNTIDSGDVMNRSRTVK